MKYLFSIIIPVYNSEKYLYDTVKSILIQKVKNTEIILINDCSTDKTNKICRNLSKNYSFIKTINHKKNFGVGISRNDGIRNSQGKYLIFLDSDDSLFNNSLLGLEKFILHKSNPDVIVVRYKKDTFPHSNYKLIKYNQNGTKNSEKFINYLNRTKFPFADCWFFSVKKSFILKKKISFPNTRFGESEYFVAKTICLMKKYACFSKKFYNKNDRDSSLNHSNDYNATSSVLINLIEFNIFKKKYLLNKIKKEFVNRYIQDGFGVFSALIILRKKSEIKKLSNILEKNKNNIINLVKEPENLDLHSMIKHYGSYRGLLNYRKKIINEKISIVKGIGNNYNHIYTYCRSKYAAAIIESLRESDCQIKGIIDDNPSFSNTSFLSYKTINSAAFFKKYKKKLSKTAILIAHQRIKTLSKISRQLIKKGLTKSQIVPIIF